MKRAEIFVGKTYVGGAHNDERTVISIHRCGYNQCVLFTDKWGLGHEILLSAFAQWAKKLSLGGTSNVRNGDSE
jgi:hypothetical protein